MKDPEQYFPVVMFIMLYKVVLTFESEDEILKCDHSNKTYSAVLSDDTVYCDVQAVSKIIYKHELALALNIELNYFHPRFYSLHQLQVSGYP